MDNLDDLNYILNNINASGQTGNSVFQTFGNTLNDAFQTYTVANLLTDAIQKTVDTGKEAVEMTKEWDDASTSLRMATGASKETVDQYMESYNELGKEIGAVTGSVSNSADTWLRQGYNISDTNELIKSSMILSTVAQMDSADSAKYLTSSMKGYHVAVSDVIGIVDKLCQVDLNAAVSADGLAEGMSKVSAVAESAGISMDRLLGYLAVIGESSGQEMSSVGTALRTIFLRMQDIKSGKLELIDEDGTTELLSDVETSLKNVGIDLRATVTEFNNGGDVLDNLAQKWDTLSSVQQAALRKAFAGQRQGNMFQLLMENYDVASKYMDISANSTGVATEKFQAYLVSLESKTNSLKASLEELAHATISDELYASVLDTSKAVVDLTTDTGILKGLLVGLGTSGAIYTFQQLTRYLGDATQGFANLNEAMSMTRGGAVSINDMQRLIDLTGGLSQSQTRLLLSTTNLTDAQKISILMNQGMSQAQAQTFLTTNNLSAAQQAATTATVTLSSSLRGLWTTLLANPLVLVTTAVTSGVTAFNAYKNHVEEVRQATSESASAYKESTSSIDDYISRYQDLQKALQDAKGNEEQTASVKQQLLDLQTELNSKFGEEAKAINLVTGEYEKQIEAIRALNKEEANKFLNENRKGIATATKKMEKEKSYSLSYGTVSTYTYEGKALQDIASSYADKGMVVNTDESTGMITVTLTADAQTAYDTINDFETDLRNKAKDLGNEKLFDSVFEVSSGALNNAKSVVDKYGEIYNQALMAELVTDDDLSATYNEALNAVEAYNEALVTGKNVEEAKKNLDDVKAKIEGNSETWGKYASITEDLFAQAGTNISNYADTVTDTMGKVEESTKFTKTQMIDTINSMADGFDVLDDIYADVLDGETFDFTKLDTSKFSEAFSEITPEYEKFIETVSSSPTDIEACQGAFNDLVSAFIDSKGILSGLTEENKDLTISMLQNMGVANAEDIVLAHLNGTVQELALYKQFTAEKGYELANASYAEAAEFLNEAEASAVAKQELAQLALEKINVNENQISTASDIDNIITLAETARAGTAELAQLAKAKSVLSAVESAGNRERAGISEKAYQDALKTVEQINNGTFKYNYQKIDRSKFSVADYDIKPKYSGAKTTADAIEKANKSASDSAKDAAEEAKKAYSDWFDFMDVRVEKINDAFTNLEKGMENVVGAFAKNQLVDAQLGIVDEEINNYTDALAMYKQQAQNVLSTIEDADLRDKIVNGAVELSQIQGENADVVKSAIEAYQNWSGKIQDCQIKLAELQKELENLELAKFTNIVDDFNDMFDLREDGKDLIEKQIDLIRESGNFVGKSYYQTLVEQSGKQLVLLEEEKAKLVSQMNSSLNSGRVKVGSEAWVSMLDNIQDVEESILDVKTNIEELDTELLNLHYEVFEKVQENFDNIGSELDNLAGLFDDELEIKVSDGNGNWTDEALGQLGLLAQNLELSKYRVTEYGKEIEKLSQDYLDGKYTLLEYQEKLAELSQGQWDAVNSAESLEDAIIDLNQTRIDEEIETIEDEIDAYEKLIDTQLELIDETEELRKKREDLAEKSKSVTDIERQLASMQNDDSQATIAKRKLLEEELANAKKDLENAEHEYSVESQKSALEQQLEDYQNARNAEIEALRLSLENRELLISQSFENVKQNASTVGEQIALIAQEHGIVASNAIISPWTQGENAIASYGEVLSVQSSAFIGNIIGVENEVYNLQNEANVASVALSNMFATRADNLVGQLQASWYAEDNLNTATGILQQSLVNTLERGYNIGGITSALGGIQSGLNGVADAANRAAQAIQNALSAQERRTSIEFGGGNGNKAYRVKDIYSGEVLGSFTDYNTAYDFWKNNKASSQIAMYAKGGVIKKDDNPLTPIAKSLGEDTVIVGKEGERVLTQKQNDLFETMVKNLEKNGNNFQWNIPNLVVPNNIPLLEKVNRPNVTLHYDKMYEINGDIYDAHQFENKVAKISKNQTTKILNDINRDFRIHNR